MSLLLYKGVLVRALNLHRDQKSLTRTEETWKIPVVHVWIDLHAFIMNNFEHRVLRIERIDTAVQRCASRSTEFAS